LFENESWIPSAPDDYTTSGRHCGVGKRKENRTLDADGT
tara:strand:+ start:413 stop:529 length:117 start_codon:yes stop_codon:yes gene_type:complete